MDASLDPKPFFPRLLGRPFKRTVVKKVSTPSSAYLADIARDSSPFPSPNEKPKKRKNAFMKVFTKAIPCVSGRGHQFDDDDINSSNIIVNGEKSPKPSLRGLGIQHAQGRTTLHPTTITTAITTSAQVATPLPGGHPAAHNTSPTGEQQYIGHGGSIRNIIPATPNADSPPNSPPKSPPPPSSMLIDKSPPSSLSSIPLSILGEDSAEPTPEELMQPHLDALIVSLKQIKALVDEHPAATIAFLRSFTDVPKLFHATFTPGNDEDVESLAGDFDHGYEINDGNGAQQGEDNFSAYQEETFDESTWPTGSDENVPKLILSLPTEPDLTEGETTMVVEEEERALSPELLSTQWRPTPYAVKRWRARAAAKKRQDFKLRKATSVPDLLPVASAFDIDLDDEDEADEEGEQTTVKALSSDRGYMNSVVSRIASESKRGLGIVPDGFLPSRDALASRLRKVPEPIADVEVSADDVAPPTPLAPIVEDEECESVLSPALAPGDDNESVYDSVPSSPLVGNLSAWTFMASRRLSITQAGEPTAAEPVVPERPVPKPRPASIESLSARRMSRRSAYYNRMNEIWQEKVLSQSDLSSRSLSTGFTGIRPLILPTRVARRESSERGGFPQSSRRSSVAESEPGRAEVLVAADSFNTSAPVSTEETPPAVSPAVTPPPPTTRYDYF